jgi:hypothetical protein
MRQVLIAALLALSLGCGAKKEAPAHTERERDSIVGQSRLPGARGVQGALNASDSAAARNARLDSLAAEP